METSFKDVALVHIIDEYKKNNPQSAGKEIRMIELGCGIPLYIHSILSRYPEVSFVGVEPFQQSYDKAVTAFAGNKRVDLILADGGRTGLEDEGFDIVFSFSVLEHVKYLDRFLEESVRIAKKNALIHHRYDLGHSLYPSSIKESFQVYLGNNIPSLLPIHKFVRYVDEKKVSDFLDAHGARAYKTTYHQMSNHKKLSKQLRNDSPKATQLMKDIIEWEFAISPELHQMKTLEREKLFPAVAVWAIKK